MASDDGSPETPYFRSPEEDTPSGGIVIGHSEIPSYEVAAGLFFRPLFARNLSLNFVTFPPGSGFPDHAHPEEQVSVVMEGSMEITIGGKAHTLRPGDVFVIPSDVAHSGRTFDEPCRLIDIFSPSREGIRELVASADPVRSADIDRWWNSATTDES